MKTNKRTRVISWLLTLVMLVGMLPLSALPASAADTDDASSWPTGANAVTINTSAIQKQLGCTKQAAFDKAYLQLSNALQSSNVRYIRLEDDIKNDENNSKGYTLYISGEKHLDLNGYEIEIWRNLYRTSTSIISGCDHYHPATTLFVVKKGADLTIYDTSSKGTGRINSNSDLIRDNNCATPNPARHLFRVASGGKLTVNGGTIEAGRTIKVFNWYSGRFIRQYVSGSAITADAGSTVVINGGKLISRGLGNSEGRERNSLLLSSQCATLVINRSETTTTNIIINDGEFLANAGGSCVYLSKDKGDVNFQVRGGKFTCDKNDEYYSSSIESKNTYTDNGYYYYGAGKYGKTFETIDVRHVMHPNSRITKEVTENDSGRPEVVVQPITGTHDEIIKIKNPGFSVWYPAGSNSRIVELDTESYTPLYADCEDAPNSDYNSQTSYSPNIVAAWQFVDSKGKAISNMVITDWDEPVRLSEFTALDSSTASAFYATGEYKTLTCTVYEYWKMKNTYDIQNSASYQIYFSDTDMSRVSTSMTAVQSSNQSSSTTPIKATAWMADYYSQWAKLTGRQVRFGYKQSGSASKQVGITVEKDGEASYTYTNLPEGEVTLWAEFAGFLPDSQEVTFQTEVKVFVLPKIACSTSETANFSTQSTEQYSVNASNLGKPLYLKAIDSSKLPSGAVLKWQIYDNNADEWVTLPNTNYSDLTVNSNGILKLADSRSGTYRSWVQYNGQSWYSPIDLCVVGKDKTIGQSIRAINSDGMLIRYDGTNFSDYTITVTRNTEGAWGKKWQVFALVKQGQVPDQAWANLWSKWGKNAKYYGTEGDSAYYLIPMTDIMDTATNDVQNTQVKVTNLALFESPLFLYKSQLAEGSYTLTPVVKIWATTDTSDTPAYTIKGASSFFFNVGAISTGMSLTVDGEEVVSSDGFTKKQESSNKYLYTKENGSYTMTNKQTVQLNMAINKSYPDPTYGSINYISSDTAVLTVEKDGLSAKVTAYMPGTATVYAVYVGTEQGIKYTYTTAVDITVPIAELKMSEPVWENYIGGYYKDIKLNISKVRSYNGEWVDNTNDKYATSKALAMTTYATGQSMWSQFSTLKVAYNDSYTVTFAVKASDGYRLPLSDLAYYDDSGNPHYYNYKDYYCADDMSLKTNKLGSDSMNTARANGYATLTSDDYSYYAGWTGADYSAPAIGVVCEIPCIKDPNATYIKKVSVTTATPKEGDLRCAVMPSDDVIGTGNYNEVNMLGAKVTTMMTMTNTKDGGALLGVRGSASKLTTLTGSGISYEPLATTERSANNYFIEYYTALGDSNWLIDKTKLQTAKYEAGTYVNQIEIWSAVDAEDGNKYYFDPDVELIVNGYKVQLVQADGTTGGYHTTYLQAAYYYAVDGNPAFVAGTVSGLPAPTAGTSSDYSSLAINGTRSDGSSSSDALTFSKLIWFIDADGDKQPDDNEIAKQNENGEYQNLDSNGGFLGGKTYSIYIELAAEEGSRIDSASFQLKLNVNGKDVTLNTSGTSGTYTFPETEIVGYDVSGSVVSFLNGTDAVTIQLIEQGHTEVAYETTVTGGTQSGNKYTAAYSFSQVPAGTYTMKVSKANHVTREYTVTVGAAAVTQDVEIWLLGDVTGDGKVNMKDWNSVYAHVNETALLTDYALKCSEVTGDGKVNMKDWNRIYEHVNETNLLWQ